MKLRDLANPHIRDLEPYRGGKPIDEVERELGISGAIKLASNECPLGPSPRVLAAIEAAARDLNRYPDGACFYLRRELAGHLGVEPGQLCFGCGSDELLELLAKVFLSPGDEAIFTWPSFAMYPIVTRGMGARPIEVKLDSELRTDVSALVAALTPKTRLLFLANPNNPTGTSIGASEFQNLLDAVPENVVVVADEAYFEFARRDDFPETLGLLAKRQALIVLRSFSKAYGLAGLRIGYGIGTPEMIDLLDRARHPFNVSSLAEAAAREALGDEAHAGRIQALNRQGLAQLEQGLDALGIWYAQSDTNFLLLRLGDRAEEIYERLLRTGIITRRMSQFGLEDALRVTVGLPEENERFLKALRRLLESAS